MQADKRTLRFLWIAAAAFSLTVAICMALMPDSIWSHAGISRYGNFRRTFFPFSIGLVLTAYCLVRMAQRLTVTPAARIFRWGLELVAIGLLGVVATPSLSSVAVLPRLHMIFGFVMFATQAAVSLYYVYRIMVAAVDWLLLIVQIVGWILILWSFDGLRVMVPAQILTVAAFGALLLRAVQTDAPTRAVSRSRS